MGGLSLATLMTLSAAVDLRPVVRKSLGPEVAAEPAPLELSGNPARGVSSVPLGGRT